MLWTLSFQWLENLENLRTRLECMSHFDRPAKSIWMLTWWTLYSQTTCLWFRSVITKTKSFLLDQKKTKRVKINDVYNSWAVIIFGVLEGSVLSPLLFYIYNLFMITVNNRLIAQGSVKLPFVISDQSWRKSFKKFWIGVQLRLGSKVILSWFYF